MSGWAWIAAVVALAVVAVVGRRPIAWAVRRSATAIAWIGRSCIRAAARIPYELGRARRWLARRSGHVVAYAGSQWSRPATVWRQRSQRVRDVGHRVLQPVVVVSTPLRAGARRGAARVTRVERLVSGRGAVVAALDGVDTTGREAPLLHTVYADRLAALEFKFVLGENRFDDVKGQREQVIKLLGDDEHLRRTDDAVRSAERLSTALISASEGTLDAIGGLIVPCAERAMARFLELPDEAGGQLFAAGQLLLHRVFLNPPTPLAPADWFAERASREATRAFLGHLARRDTPERTDERDDVQLSPEELAEQHARWSIETMAATAIGPHVAWVCSRTLDDLLRHRDRLGADSAWRRGTGELVFADESSLRTDDRRVPLLLEAMRHEPAVTGLIRQCPYHVDLTHGTGTPPDRRPLRTGTTFVYTRTAEFDPARRGGRSVLAFDPDRFTDPDTAPPTMSFGSGLHECLGRQLALRLMVAILTPLLSRDAIRREPSRRGLLGTHLPPYSPLHSSGRWPFPTRLYVRFEPGVAVDSASERSS